MDVSGVELIVADLNDKASLDRVAAKATVVLTTVAVASVYAGEAFEYAGSLLEACVQHGTHLIDLDGELWMDDVATREKVDAAARATQGASAHRFLLVGNVGHLARAGKVLEASLRPASTCRP